MAESEKVIRRAVLAGYRPRSVLTNERWLPAIEELLRDIDAVIYLADDRVIHEVAGYRVHRGALASMHRQALPTVDQVIGNARRLVVLELPLLILTLGPRSDLLPRWGSTPFSSIPVAPTRSTDGPFECRWAQCLLSRGRARRFGRRSWTRRARPASPPFHSPRMRKPDRWWMPPLRMAQRK